MKKTITLLMLLALAIPTWAGEKTVTISRNEGTIGQDASGVYYIEKDGIVFTLSGGLDNDNYLLYMSNESSNTVFSYNYVIKKIIFHCIDDFLEGNNDVFYWGPSTLSELHGKGSYSYSGKTGIWVGSETSLHFSTKGKPVRFGSIEVTYEKLEGDIFDLVTNIEQIQEGKSYILVSQTYDKVMSYKGGEDQTHRAAPIVGWPLGTNNKTKVKVDGEARVYKMVNVKDSVGNRRNAFLYILNGYLRSHSSKDYVITGDQLPPSTDYTNREYYRAVMMLGTLNNCMTYFRGGNGASKPIRYDYVNKDFRLMSTSDEGTRAWLYKLSESYHVYTTCDPADGGSIILGDGVLDGTSQEGETVNFTVTTNTDYEIKNVTLISNGETTVIEPDENGNYSFIMPGNDVTVKANLISPLYLLGTANGQTEWHTYGPRFNYNLDTDEYYIDVYFKGSSSNYGNYTGGELPDEAYGYFGMTWKINNDNNWDDIKSRRAGAAYNNFLVDENTTNAYLCYNSGYDSSGYYQNYYQNSFKINSGLYRIYVGTAASGEKGFLQETQMKIEKQSISLTFDPAGGATAAEAVEVPLNQLVVLSGDLYGKIKAINPNEDDGNFMYKATKTIDGSATSESESAGANTITITTLTTVNDGETVTQLDGTNYLGWIHADNTAYYKVFNTPLGWIEQYGDKGKTYTVADQLQGVYAKDGHLWCKDLKESIVYTEPATGQNDYVSSTLNTDNHRFASNMRTGNWDQSNWVELDFTQLDLSQLGTTAALLAQSYVDKFITEGSVAGVYSDDVNYTITLNAVPTKGEGTSYMPNTYYTNNFIESNLAGVNNYYFLNPKVQEYAIITYAMWDVDNQIMVAPSISPFNGAAVLGRWDLNEYGDQLSSLDAAANANNEYEFHIIVQRANKSYGSAATATQGVAGLKAETPTPKAGQTASAVIMAQPLDLKASSPLPTAINGVASNAQPVNVEYINLAGVRSSKPFSGVNIVVTRYTDGSTTTTKVIRK